MITSCIAIIFGFRFFGRGLHEISGEENGDYCIFHVVSVCSVPVACRYLKDDEIDSKQTG